jgi:hypothetical protein
MQYRRLGSAGMRVSAIGLGSWLTYGNAIEEEIAINCIHKAYEAGINFFTYLPCNSSPTPTPAKVPIVTITRNSKPARSGPWRV